MFYRNAASLPMNIAHRGARSHAPENTIAAAKKAAEYGAAGWEADVWLTKDGVPVITHDEDIRRTSDAEAFFPSRASYLINDFTFAEIKSLDFGSWFMDKDPFGEIAAGRVAEADLKSYENERIPTLEEALDYTRDNGLVMNVEIKDAGDGQRGRETVRKTIDVIIEMGMAGDVIVSSFNWAYLKWIREISERIMTGALTSEAEKDHPEIVRALGAYAYHPKIGAFSVDILRRMTDAGIHVNVWTVNDQSALSYLKTKDGFMGLGGVITDYPQRFADIVTCA